VAPIINNDSLSEINTTELSERHFTGTLGNHFVRLDASFLDRSLGSEVYIYPNKQNMIAIVAVRPNIILGRQDLFSSQKGPTIFIFEQIMPYSSKNILFRLRFNYGLKRYSQKEKTGRVISDQDSRLSATGE
jgi:hypothetical protein